MPNHSDKEQERNRLMGERHSDIDLWFDADFRRCRHQCADSNRDLQPHQRNQSIS